MRLLWLPILLLAPVIQAAVLAIDYGAEFTKLSLVKPGVPFDVILDRDSKRKIQSVVGWKREDRVFGAEGKMSVSLLHGFITGNKLMSSRQDSRKLISPMSNLYWELIRCLLPSLLYIPTCPRSRVQPTERYTSRTQPHHLISRPNPLRPNRHGHRLHS
jgi:hypothetical protein